MILTLLKWLSYGVVVAVVGSWLLDLTADVLRHDPNLDKFDGGVSDSGEGRWTLHSAVDLGVPTPVISAALFETIQLTKTWRVWKQNLKWDAIHVRRTQCSVTHLESWQYPLFYPQSISGYEKVRITTTKQTSTTEMEQHTRTLVIFGATGDLCRRETYSCIMRTFTERKLLPDNFLIIGASSRDHDRQSWLESLGSIIKAEFSLMLDYHRCDLSDVDSLRESIPQS